MAKNEYKIVENVVGRLIEADYLHSNMDNFCYMVNSRRMYDIKEDTSFLDKLEERLLSYVEKSNKQMNQFYEDYSETLKSKNLHGMITERDTISKKGEGYEYNPAGARQYTKNFLINQNRENTGSNQKMSREQVWLKILNSKEAEKKLNECYQQAVIELGNKVVSDNQITNNFIEQLSEGLNFSEHYKQSLQQSTINEAINILSNMFNENAGKGKVKIKTKQKDNKFMFKGIHSTKDLSELFSSSKIKNFMTEKLNLNDFSIRNKEEIQKFHKLLRAKIIGSSVYKRTSELFWDYACRKYLKFFPKANSEISVLKKSKVEKVFIDEMETILQKYSFDFIQVNNKSNTSGFLLEFGFYMSNRITTKALGKNFIKLLGQEKLTRTYLTKIYDEKSGETTFKESSFTGEHTSDIEINCNKKTYRFQLKNSFADEKTALSFRAQASIKVNTFIETAFTNMEQDFKSFLEYLLVNTAYGKYLGTLNPNTVPEIKEYIQFFLQQAYNFLIGYEYDVDKVEEMTKGNIGYIYKGKYLIPVTAFFFSALEMISLIKHKKTKDKLAGIGGIHGLPNMTFDTSGINPNEIIKEKRNALNEALGNNTDGVYRYPENMVEVGSKYGKTILNTLKFNQISIVLLMDKLDKYFKEVK